jgi:hypothetical protein
VDLSNTLSTDGLPQMQDMGFAKNLIPCAVRTKASWISDILISIPSLSKLTVLSTDSSWAFVEFSTGSESLRGYVDLNNLVLKIDFASFVLTTKNIWRPVQYRELGLVVLDKNDKIPLSEVKAMVTHPERGIIAKKEDKLSLSLKNQVTIQRFESGEWNVSRIKNHGEVYWQYTTPEVWQTPSDEQCLTTDQLLKREIAAVAFHPKNPKWGVVSAQGIYITTDGKRWAPVSSFAKRDYPVAVNSKGDIVIGNYRSRNFGRSFEPYIHWEQLTQMIEQQTKKTVPILQIKNVSFNEWDELKIDLDTSGRQIKISGPLKDQPSAVNSWHIIN